VAVVIVVFETITGSTYEVDEIEKKIRRVSGKRPAQPRQGEDGEWKPYEATTEIAVGRHVVIQWPAGTPLHEGSPYGAKPCTITSTVVRTAVREEVKS